MPNIIKVPVTKAKGQFVEIDADAIPVEVYAEALLQGLKVLANRGTSKIVKAGFKSDAEYAAAAMDKATEQVEAINTGKIKYTGKAKADKGVSREITTEAMRIARGIVKDEIKRAGGKISHYAASEITKYAKAYVEVEPSILEQAKVNIAERAKVPMTIDLASLKPDAKLVAAAEAKTKKGKGKGDPLSAAQAGKPAKHKPQAQHA